MELGVKKFEVEINGQKEKVTAQKFAGRLWVHIGGQTFSIETTQRSHRKGSSASKGQPGQVMAPMPGKILKVLAKTGDQVKKDDSVIVMEAMKMEYTLKTDINGVVEKMGCQVGDQVNLGQLLVSVKES